MQCDARSMVNQGDGEGVYSGTRPNRSPKICQEIARNAPPQVIFFRKNEKKPIKNNGQHRRKMTHAAFIGLYVKLRTDKPIEAASVISALTNHCPSSTILL